METIWHNLGTTLRDKTCNKLNNFKQNTQRKKKRSDASKAKELLLWNIRQGVSRIFFCVCLCVRVTVPFCLRKVCGSGSGYVTVG